MATNQQQEALAYFRHHAEDWRAKAEDGGIRIEMRLTQQELASMVGASRESVNKVMGYFTEKNFISTDKQRITLHRIADLKRRI